MKRCYCYFYCCCLGLFEFQFSKFPYFCWAKIACCCCCCYYYWNFVFNITAYSIFVIAAAASSSLSSKTISHNDFVIVVLFMNNYFLYALIDHVVNIQHLTAKFNQRNRYNNNKHALLCLCVRANRRRRNHWSQKPFSVD